MTRFTFGASRKVVLVSAIGGAVLVALAHQTPTAHAAAPSGRSGSSHVAQASDATGTIEIPEVECAACSLVARKAIKGAGGVRRLNEGDPKHRIIVTYEPGAGRPEAYTEALHKAGFEKAHEVGRS